MMRQSAETATIETVMRNSLVALATGMTGSRSPAPGPTTLVTRPSCQINGAMAKMIRPVITFSLSTAPPRAANEIAVLVHDSAVRSLARPESRSSGSIGRRILLRGRHRRAERSRTMPETIAIPVMAAASTHGITDRGSGSPRRSARWLRTHSA